MYRQLNIHRLMYVFRRKIGLQQHPRGEMSVFFNYIIYACSVADWFVFFCCSFFPNLNIENEDNRWNRTGTLRRHCHCHRWVHIVMWLFTSHELSRALPCSFTLPSISGCWSNNTVCHWSDDITSTGLMCPFIFARANYFAHRLTNVQRPVYYSDETQLVRPLSEQRWVCWVGLYMLACNYELYIAVLGTAWRRLSWLGSGRKLPDSCWVSINCSHRSLFKERQLRRRLFGATWSVSRSVPGEGW